MIVAPFPSHRCRTGLAVVTVMIAALSLQGCAAGLGMTLLGVGAGTASSAGINHELGGIAYKTFTAPPADVHAATRMALKTMGIPVEKDEASSANRSLTAHANDRDIDIQIEEVTPRTTRLRVVASEFVVLKDSATATEIIMQTAQALDTLPPSRPRTVGRTTAKNRVTRRDSND
jgi:hypothetical protein